MRITYFRIENFRNIRLAECDNPPDFVVICGGNGCGKSALLQALMTAKEYAAPYGGFTTDPRAVSADAPLATVQVRLRFSDTERAWYQRVHNNPCPEEDEIVIEIRPGGAARATKRSDVTRQLLSWYSRTFEASPGFFEYIDDHRMFPKKQLSTWDASSLGDERMKQSLGEAGGAKFRFTKEYLASRVMGDLQELQASYRAGAPVFPDSLKPIREFFNRFFAPMEFLQVRIDTSPFQYTVRTPRGDIDIDDLSAGEKEVFSTFIRFHQLHPRDAVVLFDEADAHLHPDLERRYLEVLRELGKGNQIWLTTHSPEMMIEAGADALYTVLKEPPANGQNQFVRVSTTDALHEALSEMMGSRGLVSFNQRIIFIEGEESSADRQVYEEFYPPGQYNVSFVPAGNSATVRKTAERVNELLTAGIGFQQYFSIVDGDIDRAVSAPTGGRLHQLPVYHVENLLLDERIMFEATRDLLADKCPYATPQDLSDYLQVLLLRDAHIKPFTSALNDARVAQLAKRAWDAVYKREKYQHANSALPGFASLEQEAKQIMADAIRDRNWKTKCKGRDLLKAYCGEHKIRYEHFRNLVISKMKEPPAPLKAIMDKILAD